MPTLLVRWVFDICSHCATNIEHPELNKLDRNFCNALEYLTGFSRHGSNPRYMRQVFTSKNGLHEDSLENLLALKAEVRSRSSSQTSLGSLGSGNRTIAEVRKGDFSDTFKRIYECKPENLSEEQLIELVLECVELQQAALERNRIATEPNTLLGFARRSMQEMTIGSMRTSYEENLGALAERISRVRDAFIANNMTNIDVDSVDAGTELKSALIVYQIINHLRPIERNKSYTGMAFTLFANSAIQINKQKVIVEAIQSLAALDLLCSLGRQKTAQLGRQEFYYKILMEKSEEFRQAIINIYFSLTCALLYEERKLQQKWGIGKKSLHSHLLEAYEGISAQNLPLWGRGGSFLADECEGTLFISFLSSVIYFRIDDYSVYAKSDKASEPVVNAIQLIKEAFQETLNLENSDEEIHQKLNAFLNIKIRELSLKRHKDVGNLKEFLTSLNDEINEIFNLFKKTKLINLQFFESKMDPRVIIMLVLIKYMTSANFELRYNYHFIKQLYSKMQNPVVKEEKFKLVNDALAIDNKLQELLDPNTDEQNLKAIKEIFILNIAKSAANANLVACEEDMATYAVSGGGQLAHYLEKAISNLEKFYLNRYPTSRRHAIAIQ